MDQSGYQFIEATSSFHFTAAVDLFREYAASLDFDLCFQGFDKELSEIGIQYNLPSGGLILLMDTDRYVGCAGVRRWDDRVGELKRMYIQPAYRRRGLGKELMDRAIALSRRLGYERIRLDTMISMQEAIRVYRKAGFYPIEAYRFNPGKEVLYFEKDLRV